MSQWRPPNYDIPTREEKWFRSSLESHDSFCGCGDPVLHFSRMAAHLDIQGGPSGSPPSPPPRRPQIRGLPALPAPEPRDRRRHSGTENPSWRGGGGDGADGGPRGDGDGGAADEYQGDALEELADLLDDPE